MLLLTSPFTDTVLPLYLEELASRSPIGVVEAQAASRRANASGGTRRTARDEPKMVDGSGTGSEAYQDPGNLPRSVGRGPRPASHCFAGRLAVLDHLDPGDAVGFQDRLRRRPPAVDHPEHGELVIEQRVVHQVDEPLPVAGVASSGGDPERPARVHPGGQLVPHEG